jgi:hypothetical protein
MGIRIGISNIDLRSRKASTYWTQRKPYFVIDNTGNNQALIDAQIKITLTGADITIASILADGSNLFFYYQGGTFIHSYINYLTATSCEVYVKISCPAFSLKYIGLKLEDHAFVDDYSGVMLRRTAHASTNMLYACSDEHDSLTTGPDITLVNGAAILETKFGNVLSFDGSNDHATLDVLTTIPEYGGFGFNFILPDNSWDNGSLHTIFSKAYTTAKSYLILQITEGGFIKIYSGDGTNDASWLSSKKPEIGKIHSFYVRWTKLSTIIYFDDEIVIAKNKKITASPINPDTVFFGGYNATLQKTKCYIFDIEYNNISLPIIYQRSHDENISLFNRTQAEKLTAISNIPANPAVSNAWGEGTLIIEDDLIKLYHQKNYSDADLALTHNIFCLSISHDFGITWDDPITLMGYGTAVENTIGIFRAFVFKDSGKYYVIFQRYNTPGNTTLYIRESTDGVNFTNPQTFLTNTYGAIDNCSIINDNGVYKGLVDVSTTVNGEFAYVQYYIEGNTLLTMGYGATNPQTTIGLRSIYNFGAPHFIKVGNKYICWTEQSLVNDKNILPDQCYYSECSDPSANNWITKSVPIQELDSIFADDQMVDGSITEYNGNTYFISGKNNNTASPNGLYMMTLYKYTGTIAQFITDITVTHSEVPKLTLTPISETEIELEWTPVGIIEIEKSTDNITFTKIFTSVSNITKFRDTGLTTNTPYYYKIHRVLGNVYSDVVSANTFIAVGSNYLGGILAYTFQAGDPGFVLGIQHGLIAHPTDNAGAAWGCYGTAMGVNAQGSIIGTGALNTATIAAGCATAGIPAKLCAALTTGGYSDWILPSSAEMTKLILNGAAIGLNMSSAYYWSSTEIDLNNASRMLTPAGGATNRVKTTSYVSRAIRYF